MRKNRWFFAISAFIVFSWTGAPLVSAGSSAKAPSLDVRVQRILKPIRSPKAVAGVEVRSLEDGAIHYAKNASRLLRPASLTKLFTSAAALWYLRPDYTFQTEFFALGPIIDGQLKGDLGVKGYGDPDLVEERLWLAAKALSEMDLTQVTGNLILDDSYFDDEKYPSGWPGGRSRARGYHAPLGALSVNFNAVRHGSRYAAIQEAPALRFGRMFRELLLQNGVVVAGELRRASLPPLVPDPLLTIESKPLRLIVYGLNKFSNNFVAEQILKTMGTEHYGPPGTTEKGLQVIRQFIETELRIPQKDYVLSDGSGLSSRNRFTAQQFNQLLLTLWENFHLGPEFVASLKIGGVDYDSEGRFSPETRGELRVKSGHLNGVNTLAGYMKTQSNHLLSFCVMLNDFGGDRYQQDRAMERIVDAIRETL